MKVDLTDSDIRNITSMISNKIDMFTKNLQEIARRETMSGEHKEIMLKLDRRYFMNKNWKRYSEREINMCKKIAKKLGQLEYVERVEKSL